MRYTPDFFVAIYNNSPLIIKNIFGNIYGIIKYFKEYNSKYRYYLKIIKKYEYCDKDSLREYQEHKLRKIYKHSFSTVPYYNNLYKKYGLDENSIRTLDDLVKIPLLSKEDVRKNYNSLISLRPSRLQFVGQTSGTTGKPLMIDIDVNSEAFNNAVITYQNLTFGCNDKWYATLAGYRILPSSHHKPPFWLINYFRKQIHLSTIHLSKDTIKYYVDIVRRKNVKYIRGYPSAIGKMASLMLEINESYPLDAVFVSSEVTLPWMKDAIKKAFKCEVIDFYGQVERLMWGITCTNGNLHLLPLSSIIEIYDNKPVVTTLINYRMPLIRYELDDEIYFIDKKCGCGKTWPLIKPIVTRRGDYLLTPSGKVISSPILTIAFWGIEGIGEVQIHQIEYNKVIIRISPTENFNESSLNKIIHNLKETTCNEIIFDVILTSDFMIEPSGKRKFIVRDERIN